MARKRSDFMLSSYPRVPYSPREARLFKMLGEQPTSSRILVSAVYGRAIPINGRRIISGAMKTLARKVVLNRERFRVAARRSREVEYWIDRR
jgi:hypothetical protein